MSAFLANLSVAVGVLLAGIGLLLAFIGFVAYRRIGAGKLLWVSVAFVGFAVQGVLFAVEGYRDRAEAGWPGTALLSLVIVIALYLAVLKR